MKKYGMVFMIITFWVFAVLYCYLTKEIDYFSLNPYLLWLLLQIPYFILGFILANYSKVDEQINKLNLLIVLLLSIFFMIVQIAVIRFPSLPYFSLVSDKKLEICGSVCFGYFLTVLLKTIYLERESNSINITES